MSIIDKQRTLDHGHMKDSMNAQWQFEESISTSACFGEWMWLKCFTFSVLCCNCFLLKRVELSHYEKVVASISYIVQWGIPKVF